MKEIEVIKWQEGTNLKNYSKDEIFDSIQEIDLSVFSENGLASRQSDIDRYEAYKDSYIFVLCDNKIIGYLCYFPITENFYKLVIEGKKVYDGDIKSTDICNINSSSNYIFLLSVALLPEFQKQGISKRFSEILLSELSKIEIKDMVSYAFTAAGEHFLNVFGLKSCKEMEDGIKLMRGYIKNDNFDLILTIPLKHIKGKRKISKKDFESMAELSLSKMSDNIFSINGKEMKISNAHNNRENLKMYADTFCEQIEEHGKYELVMNDEAGNINIERIPFAFGHVIIYKDEKNDEYDPYCCYNFFAVISNLTFGKNAADNDSFDLLYFVVPDINYHDLTLLMDQSFEIWCSIMGKNYGESEGFLKKFMNIIGYRFLGKIYRIVFSDLNQFEHITNSDITKLYNIMASEEYKSREEYSHQIELSQNEYEYTLSHNNKIRDFILTKKEKFYDDYAMYSSYYAFASIYSYYYVINEEKKSIFKNRIEPDHKNANFSSEANILFILETEIFKITACLALSDEINNQIDSPDMKKIKKMFKSFINTRPLFEKMNYCYLGAQKEADFIYEQFRTADILVDYDRKRDLLKNYSEVITSITADKNAKIFNCIGILFTFVAGYESLSYIIAAFENGSEAWTTKSIVLTCGFLLLIGVVLLIIIEPFKYIKKLIKHLSTLSRNNIFKKL